MRDGFACISWSISSVKQMWADTLEKSIKEISQCCVSVVPLSHSLPMKHTHCWEGGDDMMCVCVWVCVCVCVCEVLNVVC